MLLSKGTYIQLLHIMLSYNHDYKNQHLKHPTTIMY